MGEDRESQNKIYGSFLSVPQQGILVPFKRPLCGFLKESPVDIGSLSVPQKGVWGS